MHRPSFRIIFALLTCAIISHSVQAQGASSTAWQAGHFHIDVAGVVSRSAIVLARPNLTPAEAMPLGNGSLGVAVWSAEGLTAQLNRADTMPDRLSAGHVVVPGITRLISARDYSARLDLYRGEFREQGGGMTATAFVEPASDTLVIEVKGANPDQLQSAMLKLWSPRTPHAAAEGRVGLLAQSWIDNVRPESSGRPFGSLSAITADARDVSASVSDPLTVKVSFRPYPDGHFRILATAPHYDGSGSGVEIAARALNTPSGGDHWAWWQDFWHRAGLIKITSSDGAGEYMENLRNIYLYVAACEKGTDFPGSQAGVADMISAADDVHKWDPSAFWHWNLRMQVAANIGAGLPELNAAYFHLYRSDLPAIEAWTRQHMKGLPGSCVPETMRFNGRGIEYEAAWTPAAMGLNCALDFKPYYNARTLTTGAEVSLWIWRQFLVTNDKAFLAENYPLMAASARFLLAYQKKGADGRLNTSPSNAHENQWDVMNPTTDIAAITALYSATIGAARLLDKDADLVRRMEQALPMIPALPRTQPNAPHTLLTAAADAGGNDVIADSYQPDAEIHNVENIGLEPVWPYDLIGDTSPLFALARRTYEHRPAPIAVDWSYDPIQAARLQLGGEVRSTLIALTEKFQIFPNGMAKWSPEDHEFYVEQTGVVADALEEALVQDYDGTIRIAPAIPPGWDFDGSVYVRGKTKVDVQTRNGIAATVVIEAGDSQRVKLRSPWPGQSVDVFSGNAGAPIVFDAQASLIEFKTVAGESYLIRPHGATGTRSFEPISGTPATSQKKLGPVQIGIF